MRSVISALVLLVPGVSFASVGVSWSPPTLSAAYQTDNGVGVGGFGGLGLYDATYLPTLDVRLAQVDLQFHVLDLLANIAGSGDIVLGANAYWHVVEEPLAGDARIVFHPGAQVDIGYYTDPDYLWLELLVAGRAGVEIGDGPGLGVYAIPNLGVIASGDASSAIFGGQLGFSVWY